MADQPTGGPSGPQFASATHLAYFIPLAVIFGMLIGRWLGAKWGHPQGGLLAGFAWGLATAGWEVWKVSRRMGGGRGR